MNSSLRYLKVAALCIFIFILGVALFQITVFQGVRLIFPNISHGWAVPMVPFISFATMFLANTAEIPQSTWFEKQLIIIEDLVEDKIMFWGFSFKVSDLLMVLFMYSFGWYSWFEWLVHQAFYVTTLPVKFFLRK